MARAVPGDAAPAIDVDYRGAVGRAIGRLGAAAGGVDRWMGEQQHGIRAPSLRSRRCQVALPVPGRLVGHLAGFHELQSCPVISHSPNLRPDPDTVLTRRWPAPGLRRTVVDKTDAQVADCSRLPAMSFEVGGYRAVEMVGNGASAQVWAGVRIDTGAPVAIKVFAPDRLPAARREAALAAAVDHPHVVSVIDVLATTECAALVTELAAGGDLADLLDRRGRLSAGETLTVLLPMAAALATAHERQIVHGDLSAQNIVFDSAGRPLLADLGAARAAAEVGLPVAATPVDAAPELARGGGPTPATDMFALGSIGLACLTGQHAWPAEDLRDVMIQAAAGQWPDPPDGAGSPALISVIRDLLDHDPERRPGAASVVIDLRGAGTPEPVDLLAAVKSGDERATADGAVVIGGELPGRAGGPVSGTGRHLWASRSERESPNDRQSPNDRPPAKDADSGERPGPARLDRNEPSTRERLARARAITRVRQDAVPRVAPPSAGRWWRRRTEPTPRAGARAAFSTARSLIRTGVIVVSCLLAVVLAGTAGLWWARSDRSDPVAFQPAATALATTANGAAPPVAAASALSTTSPATTTADPPGRSVPRALSATSAAPRSTARTAATQADRPPTGWKDTISALDSARARALVARDPSLLDAVYTLDSAARSADAAMIARLLSDGLRVSGARHMVRTATQLGGSPVRIAVNDSLPSYSVLDGSGKVVGRTQPRAVATRVLILVPTPGGYRISKVESA